MNEQGIPSQDSLAQRYVALWNEGDDETRRRTIRSLWVDGGEHVAPRTAVRGYEELEARVARSYQRWIVEEGCTFRYRGDAVGHHNVVRFTWEMVDRAEDVESIGTEILVLDDAGKIVSVYQFIEA